MSQGELMYVAGRYVAAAEATVSASDAGLLLGAGLFETVRVYAAAERPEQPGRPLRLAAHLARLRASGQVLRIFVRETDAEIAEIIRRLLEANRLVDARVRITATRGPREQGLEDDVVPPATLLVAAGPMTHYPADFYAQGVTVVVSDIRANETDPTTFHKMTATMRGLLALRDAHRARAAEVLLFNTRKRLAGGALSNVFLVKGGRLLTPPVEDGLVPGITRATVLELAAEVGVPAEQTSLIINDLLEADEVFLTNSVMEVLPVVKVEGHEVGPKDVPDRLGRPGPITQRLAGAYRQLVARETAWRE
jgi:branched-chain amino acid aminotransferase